MQLSRLFLFSAGLVLSASGCRLLEDGDPGVVVVPAITPSTLELGDTIRVNTTVTNTGRETIEINANPCNTHYHIVDSRGKIVGPAERGACIAILKTVRLAPGESHVLEGFYTGILFNELADPIPGTAIYVPRGTYSVRGRVTVLTMARTVIGGSVPLFVDNPLVTVPD